MYWSLYLTPYQPSYLSGKWEFQFRRHEPTNSLALTFSHILKIYHTPRRWKRAPNNRSSNAKIMSPLLSYYPIFTHISLSLSLFQNFGTLIIFNNNNWWYDGAKWRLVNWYLAGAAGGIDIPEGPNTPKVLIFHSNEQYYSSSFHVSTGCQERRLAVVPVWPTCYPSEQQQHGSFCQGDINGRMKGSGQ